MCHLLRVDVWRLWIFIWVLVSITSVLYPNIEDHAEILKAVIGANTSDNEQKIIGSEKTEMIHQNKKECSCALALLQERTYLLRTY